MCFSSLLRIFFFSEEKSDVKSCVWHFHFFSISRALHSSFAVHFRGFNFGPHDHQQWRQSRSFHASPIRYQMRLHCTSWSFLFTVSALQTTCWGQTPCLTLRTEHPSSTQGQNISSLQGPDTDPADWSKFIQAGSQTRLQILDSRNGKTRLIQQRTTNTRNARHERPCPALTVTRSPWLSRRSARGAELPLPLLLAGPPPRVWPEAFNSRASRSYFSRSAIGEFWKRNFCTIRLVTQNRFCPNNTTETNPMLFWVECFSPFVLRRLFCEVETKQTRGSGFMTPLLASSSPPPPQLPASQDVTHPSAENVTPPPPLICDPQGCFPPSPHTQMSLPLGSQ